jgi:hypothetical protein
LIYEIIKIEVASFNYLFGRYCRRAQAATLRGSMTDPGLLKRQETHLDSFN